MEVGDVAVLFSGLCAPHVLRRENNRLFGYVWEVYCDGIIDGEAWEEEKLRAFWLV